MNIYSNKILLNTTTSAFLNYFYQLYFEDVIDKNVKNQHIVKTFDYENINSINYTNLYKTITGIIKNIAYVDLVSFSNIEFNRISKKADYLGNVFHQKEFYNQFNCDTDESSENDVSSDNSITNSTQNSIDLDNNNNNNNNNNIPNVYTIESFKYGTCKLIIYFNTYKYKNYVGNNIIIPDFDESIRNRVLDIFTNNEKQLCCHIINEKDCFQMMPLIEECEIDFIIINCVVSKFSKKGKKRRNDSDDFEYAQFDKCLRI